MRTAHSNWVRRFLCLLSPLLFGCEQADTPRLVSASQPHMGTVFTIRVWCGNRDVVEAQAAIEDAFTRIAEIETVASDYIPESELNQLAHSPPGNAIPLSDDLFQLLNWCQLLAQKTDGAFDVTIGPLVKLWRRTKKSNRLPTDEQIRDVRERFGYQNLHIDPDSKTAILKIEGMALDLGGVAKGYASDEAIKVLRNRGFPMSLVAGSGDIRLGDPPPGQTGWRVGVRSLDVDAVGEDQKLSGIVELSNAAISTSGDTQNFLTIDGVRYSHIVDPVTALGKTERIAVTVIGPTATATDSYATAASVLGLQKGMTLVEGTPEIECLIITGDSQESQFSTGFPEVTSND